MSVFAWKFKLCSLLSVLVISAGLGGAHPIHSQLEVPSEAYLNGVSVDGVDSLGFDPWTEYREKERASVYDNVTDETTTTDPTDDSAKEKVDPLSLVYYIGSFAALLLFFLVVSCSECCCEKPPSNANRNATGSAYDDCPDAGTPPPPYDEFAPPPYNSLFDGDESNKDKLCVFVVAVHEPHRTPP